jgi:hypothetical protein
MITPADEVSVESCELHYATTALGRFERRFLSSPATLWVCAVIMTVIVGGASVKFFKGFHTHEESEYRGTKRKTALGRWLPDPVALWEGENPYGKGHWFPNPPIVLIALSPFSAVNPTVAAVLWVVLKLAAILVSLWLFMVVMGVGGRGVPIGVMLLATLCGLRPIIGDIQHGNLNLFVLVQIAAVWALFVRGRHGWAGVLLALAIATKVTPALLLVYFLYKRCWKLVGWSVIGLVLWFLIVPGVVLGFGRNVELLTAWSQMIIVPYTIEGYVTIKEINQSLPGMLVKWMSAPVAVAHQWPNASLGALGDWLTAWFPVELIPHERAEFVGEGAMARPVGFLGKFIVKGAGLALIASLAWWCRRPLGDRHGVRLNLEFSLVLIAMLLLSERTWKHHMVTLAPVFIATWMALTMFPWSRWGVGLAVGVMIGLLALFQARHDVLLYVGAITLALIGTFILNCMLLRRTPNVQGEPA